MKFIPEVSESTDILWWNENRKRLNEAIRWYNEYVENKNRPIEAVLAKIEQIREYGTKNGFANWQFDILDDLRNMLVKQ